MKSSRSDREEGQLSNDDGSQGRYREKVRKHSHRHEKKTKRHRDRQRSSDSDASRRHKHRRHDSPRRHHRRSPDKIESKDIRSKHFSSDPSFVNPVNLSTSSMLQDKNELEESEFDEYLDSEEELKRDQEERQRVMDAIKLKHSQTHTLAQPEQQQIVQGQTVTAQSEKKQVNEIQPNLLVGLEIQISEQATKPQLNDVSKVFEAERETLYHKLDNKSNKVDLFANLSDSDSDAQEQELLDTIKKGFTVEIPNVDNEGYYQPRIGEIICSVYKVLEIAGKGVFSCVVRAQKINAAPFEILIDQTTELHPKQEFKLLTSTDHTTKASEVAIKIMRTKFEVMRVSGLKERDIARQLNSADPYDRKHCIRLLDSFEYNQHLCLVYESMGMNLRETLNKFGRNIGLSMDGVILYGRQLFLALSLLHRHKIIHADLKPDNIMVSVDTRKIKLCDFGSCLTPEEILQTSTEHLVSPFYRAPEIILGCVPFETAVDIWSAGVTLFEIFTGRFMFPGRSNNHLLKLIMQTKGKVNAKMIKRGLFADKHFNLATKQFIQDDEMSTQQSLLGLNIKTNVPMPQVPTRPILNQLKETFNVEKQDQRAVSMFADFLERCTIVDPQKRMTADEALLHPFLNILRERQQMQMRQDVTDFAKPKSTE